jgi:hypothetical protein
MSDFIIRFQGIELSEDQKQQIQAAIQKTVLTELAYANTLPEESGPGGPPHHGNGGGIGPGAGGGGNAPGGTRGGFAGVPVKGGLLIDWPVSYNPNTYDPQHDRWMGLRLLKKEAVLADPAVIQSQLVVSEERFGD